MFLEPITSTGAKLLVNLMTIDAALGRRLKSALDATGRFQVEQMTGRLAELASTHKRAAPFSLLVVEIDPHRAGDLAALESMLRGASAPPAAIVLADGLAEVAARRLLRLQIADWLSTSCTDRDLVVACEQALKPATASPVAHARCTTFVSAIGGAGGTTLSLAAASVFARKSRAGLGGCCVVDLNFQAGVLADYLDLAPNLQLADIAAAPERLDGHLLEVMLSRHASDLSILAAPQSLTRSESIGPDLVGRLLDLAALRFQHLIIDLPRLWLPGRETVVRGSDAFYIVTELTVTGLRQAHRLAGMLEHRFGISAKRSVIVNKVAWLSGGGVSKHHAGEVLGERLAGYVSHCGKLVLDAQNRGLLLSQVKRGNSVEAELERILFASRT
jgi:pilus assembly protein CpaE